MKQKHSKYFGKYEILDDLDLKSKQKLKKFYDDFKILLANEKKTKLLAKYIKKLLSEK